jgi:hypothetical protein
MNQQSKLRDITKPQQVNHNFTQSIKGTTKGFYYV